RLDGLCALLTGGGLDAAPSGPADPAAALRARLSLSALHSGSGSGPGGGAGRVSEDEVRDAALTVAWELVDR
ncbi:MAG: hypothetical protein QOC83_5587, partial [Pseudonocardiales bacterium]|nr:hypothetical protein [Pseudonocardiales bacterium]